MRLRVRHDCCGAFFLRKKDCKSTMSDDPLVHGKIESLIGTLGYLRHTMGLCIICLSSITCWNINKNFREVRFLISPCLQERTSKAEICGIFQKLDLSGSEGTVAKPNRSLPYHTQTQHRAVEGHDGNASLSIKSKRAINDFAKDILKN